MGRWAGVWGTPWCTQGLLLNLPNPSGVGEMEAKLAKCCWEELWGAFGLLGAAWGWGRLRVRAWCLLPAAEAGDRSPCKKNKSVQKKIHLQDLRRCLPAEEAAAMPFITSVPRAASAVNGPAATGGKGKRNWIKSAAARPSGGGSVHVCAHTHTHTLMCTQVLAQKHMHAC